MIKIQGAIPPCIICDAKATHFIFQDGFLFRTHLSHYCRKHFHIERMKNDAGRE